MKLTTLDTSAFIFLLSFFLSISDPIHAAIIEIGGLNCIDDTGNTSDGLCYLDMAYSNGLSQSAALANAQSMYTTARLATPQEWDDLFSAAGVAENPDGRVASDAFNVASSTMFSYVDNPGVLLLRNLLGSTIEGNTIIFSDPDGSTSGTADFVYLDEANSWRIFNWVNEAPDDGIGWLIVSENTVVPIPAAGWLFLSAFVSLIGKKCLSRR